MDITLIKQADFIYDRKQGKEVISDDGIAVLTDCALILLNKAGMRPLFVINQEGNEQIISSPKEKMKKPSLILFSETEIGRQSARILQEQLKTVADCSVKILPVNFSVMDKMDNFEILDNMLLTRAKSFEEKGYEHLIIVAETEILGKIARCMNGTGLKDHNIPIYSFSNGKEIQDENLVSGLYVTRDMMDTLLVKRYNASENKVYKPLPLHTIKQKLHIVD